MRRRRLCLAALAAVLLTAPAGAESESSLWYARPARLWASEALPIGNGRLGAMLFGGVVGERIQLNEISLWGGVNNWDGGFDTGDLGFGGYRNFGDLFIDWGGDGTPSLLSPSGHAAGNGQGIQNTVDGQPATKWCIEHPGTSVVWQVDLPQARRVALYSFTSAPDVPLRDPKDWAVYGSPDGKAWTELDRRSLAQPFEARGQLKTFAIESPGEYRSYRVVFLPPAGASHFQVADVALAGVDVSVPDRPETVPGDYRRSLDIGHGIHRTTFTAPDGTKIAREAFASRPDQVLVFRCEGDKPGALSGRIRFKPGQAGAAVSVRTDGLVCTGILPNKLAYACGLRVLHEGGRVTNDGEAVVFSRCDRLTFLLDARTDYAPSFADGWRGAAPMPLIEKGLTAAAAKSYETLRRAHVVDLEALLGRAALDLGRSTAEQRTLPTDERIKRYVDAGRFAQGGDDPELEMLLFQMGRYLLASSSRPGGLPANLQGLWNDSNQPAWASDYHSNINLQMNYWLAEPTGLAECAEPLVDFLLAQAEPCRRATRKAFGEKTRGWTVRTSQSPFGGNAWEWNIPASAWYALHVFDHWDFGRDERFLREKAYPLLKEICQYWEDRLKPLPDGSLVAPNGWSPEHGPREDGVMHDQQLIWELFDDYIRAASALGVDADYQQKVAELQTRLAPNKVGKWGQLQEWQTDRDDPNNRHRHTSHLFALFPGRQISLTATPELARAARVSLLARSSDAEGKMWTPANMHAESIYGWVWPWRAAMWARLGDAHRAHTLIWGKMGNTAPNMLGLNVPYFAHRQELIQLDNSFGATAAMAEMLLQSHTGEIHLLSAVPRAWANGSFRGLRARGNVTVDAEWRDGQLVRATLTAPEGHRPAVRLGGALLPTHDDRITWRKVSPLEIQQ